MQVFKTYFKVIRASAGLIFMYLAIFISIAVMISVMSPSSGSVEFSETKTRVAVINRDGDAALAKGLSDYIADIFTAYRMKMIRISFKMAFSSEISNTS